MLPVNALRTAASLGLVSLTACGGAEFDTSPRPPAEPAVDLAEQEAKAKQENEARWYAWAKERNVKRWEGAVYWAKVVQWHEGYQRGRAAEARIRASDAERRVAAAAQKVAELRREVTPQVSATYQDPGYAGDAYALPAALLEIRRCESGHRYDAENPTSTASGAFQFLDSTWAGFGGYARASHAPVAVQDDAAKALYARSGSSPWNASRGCWG